MCVSLSLVVALVAFAWGAGGIVAMILLRRGIL